VECGDFIKTKSSGLKQNNVPQGGRASAREERGQTAIWLLFYIKKQKIGVFYDKI